MSCSCNEIVIPEISCALTPYFQIEEGKSSNVEQTTGWTYSCASHTCQEVNIPEKVNVTINLFTTLEQCNGNCSGNNNQLKINLIKF